MEIVLNEIKDTINSIKCVTRWRPEEIAASVSDLEVFDLITNRPKATLLIQPLLHAKYFRIDNDCLVGSANLTHKALGWSAPNNMELVVHLPSDTPELIQFENTLLSTAFQATETLKEEIAMAASTLIQSGLIYTASELNTERPMPVKSNCWVPTCKKPELLYQIYSKENTDQIIGFTLKTGEQDILSLNIPAGFSQSVFYQYVATILRQSPIVQALNDKAINPLTLDEGREFISTYILETHPDYGIGHLWDALRAWMLFFLRDEYREPSGTSDIQKGSVIGSPYEF